MAESWSIGRAANGRPALVRPDGTWCESRFKPDLEADRRVVADEVSEGETVLLFGFGAGEWPRAILKAIGVSGRLTIAEPNGAVVELLRRAGEAADIFDDERVLVLTCALESAPPSSDRLRFYSAPAEFLRALTQMKETDRYIVHPGTTFPEEFGALRDFFAGLDLRRRSSLRFKEDLERNHRLNAAAFDASVGVRALQGTRAGSALIVAGGGPSLDECASAIGSRGNWIAVGTALKPLIARGIRPLYVVATDPQAMVGDQLALDDATPLPPLVCFPTTAHEAVLLASVIHGAYAEGDGGRALAARRAEKGELPAGGTVTTTAIGLAALLGAKRIYLAGVDLVEPGGRTHARGTAREERNVEELERFGSMEFRGTRRLMTGDMETAPTASGEEMPTRANLTLYARAIEALVRRYSGVDFVQLSPHARRLSGVRYGGFED